MFDMQEIQLLLVQLQTLAAEMAFQIVAVLGLGLVWLAVAFDATRLTERDLAGMVVCRRVASIARALGLLWLIVLVTAWPPLLERTGNVLGPMLLMLVLVLLITEGVVWRAAQSKRTIFRQVATIAVALAYTATLALVVLAQSWMNTPTGAEFVDGRLQVMQWAALVSNSGFAQAALATVLASVVLAAAWVQFGAPVVGNSLGNALGNPSSSGSSPSLPQPSLPKPSLPNNWRVVLNALAMAAAVGLLWLATQAMPDTTPFYVTLMQGASDSVQAIWVRLIFVSWLLTMAALVIGLTKPQPTQRSRALLRKLPVITAPLFWGLVYWQISGRWSQSTVAGLPVADLVSTQPVWVLAFGCLLVIAVLLAGLRMLFGLMRTPDQAREEAAA